MALFWLIKSSKKSARPNFVSAAIMAIKFWAPPAIETIVYKDKEIIYLYINIWIKKQKLNKTIVDFSAIVKFISRKIVYNLNPLICQIDKK